MTSEEKAEEVSAAYQVLGMHFGGFSAAYIQQVLEAHFWSSSDAGWEQLRTSEQAIPEERTSATSKWTLREIRAHFHHVDQLQAQGLLPPPARRSTDNMPWFKKDAKGKYYIASEEQLQQELSMQDTLGIDPDGNLVQNGQIVKYQWLQSFNKTADYD